MKAFWLRTLRAVAWSLPCLFFVGSLSAIPTAVIGNGGGLSGFVVNLENPSSSSIPISLPLTTYATCVAITPDGKTACLCGQQQNSGGTSLGEFMFVYDIPSHTITATIPLAGNSNDVAISPDSTKAYVCGNGTASVGYIAVIDLQNLSQVPTLIQIEDVGSALYAIAITPDGTRAYVCNYQLNSVSILNLETNTVIKTLSATNGYSFANPYDVAITPDGAYAMVTNYASTNVVALKISDDSETVISVFVDPWAYATQKIAISPDGTKAFVTATRGDVSPPAYTQIAVIDIPSFTMDSTHPLISFGAVDDYTKSIVAMAFTPDGSRLYAVMDRGTSGAWIGVSDWSSEILPTFFDAPSGNNSIAITGILGARHFTGKVKEKHNGVLLKMKWKKSQDPAVVYYEIYNQNTRVARVSAKKDLRAKIRLPKPTDGITVPFLLQLDTYYKIRAVDRNSNVSNFVQLHVEQ